MLNKKFKVAIATGPTGGHFFPGLAIADELFIKENIAVSFFIPNREYILQWLKKKKYDYRVMPEARLTLKNILAPVKLLYTLFLFMSICAREKFDIVVITGSYTTVPLILAARLLRVKIFVHEQNFLPGKVTKLSVYLADKIALSFPSVAGLPHCKSVVTGFPVIADFKKKDTKEDILREFGFSTEKKTVLVLGGSQGASFLNLLIAENLLSLGKMNLQFIHLAGNEKEKMESCYQVSDIKAKVFDFYFDMAKLYCATDMVICRAGGGTLAEISEWGLPAFLVPYPYAGGHQRYNALYFYESGGCGMLEQSEESIKEFPTLFEETFRNADVIKEQLKKISISDSRGETVNQLMELLNNEKIY